MRIEIIFHHLKMLIVHGKCLKMIIDLLSKKERKEWL